MPALKPFEAYTQPSDTGFPGLGRRRVWKAPDVLSHSMLVLTLPRLFLAAQSGEPKPETVAAVETAMDVESVLGPFATVVELASIRRVKLDLHTNTVHIDHASERNGQGRASITLGTPEVADEVFTKLWRRLGTEFSLRQYSSDPWTAARLPVAFMAAAIAFAGIFAIILNALNDLAITQDWPAARVLPNWKLVCGVGGAAVAIAQITLYRRLMRPPERLELFRS